MLNQLLLLFFLPTLMLIVFTLFSIVLVWQGTLARQQVKLSRSIANTVVTYTDSAKRVLDALSQAMKTADRTHLKQFLTDTQSAYSYFDTLYILGLDGRLGLMTPLDHQYIGLDLTRQPYYAKARQQKSTFVSAPFISMRSGKPTVYLAKSVESGQMVVGELNLSTLQANINAAIGGDRENLVFVADRAGSLLAHSNSQLVVEQHSVGHMEIVRQGLETESTKIYRASTGWVFGAAVPIESLDWVVISQQSLKSALGPLVRVVAPALGLSLFLWLWVLWALRRQQIKRVVAPVGRLAETAQRIAAGDLDERACLEEGKEIGELAASFNHMTQQLRNHINSENMIAGISRRLMGTGSDSLDDEINRSLSEIGRFVSADRSYLFLISEDERTVINTHEWCADGIDPFIESLQNLPAEDYPWLIQKAACGNDIIIPNVAAFEQASTGEKKEWMQQGIQSLICAPILTRGSLKGWVGFDAVRQQRDWSGEEARLLHLSGEIFYIAMQRKWSQTALKASEARYRQLVQHAPAGIFEFDLQDKRFISVNDVMCSYTGYSQAEFLALTPQTLLPETNLPRWVQRQKDLTPDNPTLPPAEHRVMGKEGGLFWALINCRFVFEDDTPVRLTAVAHDLTALRQAEAEKKQLEAKLAQVQKLESLGTLAGGIAHDFNNLLMGIQGNTSLMLLDEKRKPNDSERLTGIETFVQRGVELTQQLLGLARGGKYEVKPTDPNHLVDESATLFGRTKKELRIHQKYQPGIWRVECDRGQIHQVLLNIFVNAWHAMPDGGEIFISTANTALDETTVKPHGVSPGRYVKITIADSGIGMSPGTMKKIFDPFFTTKERQRGTGLGLASAYGIVKNHGGIIDVASQMGAGSTFTIYLPAVDKDVAENPSTKNRLQSGSETILVVDDETLILDVGRDMLEALGYRVLAARSGAEALDTYRQNAGIDLVVLDMIMPDMGGAETFSRLKQIDPEVRVLLSSGYSVDGQASEILDQGCSGFIQKPFSIHELSRKIRDILNR